MKKSILKRIILGVTTIFTVGALIGCGTSADEDKVIKVGASPSPHAEILEQIKEEVEAQGYTLEIVEYTDYVLPNTAVNDGELDANFFQHTPYLENFNEENGTEIVGVANVHFEPLGLYSNKVTSVDELSKGATVAVPNDTTNEARALLLLEANGLLTLKEDAGITATIQDIVDNPLELKFVEVEAAQLPRYLEDVDAAVINGNYAISGGLNVEDAIAVEESDSVAAQTYANILAVKKGREEDEKTQVLIQALQSDQVKKYINETYAGAVVPVN